MGLLLRDCNPIGLENCFHRKDQFSGQSPTIANRSFLKKLKKLLGRMEDDSGPGVPVLTLASLAVWLYWPARLAFGHVINTVNKCGVRVCLLCILVQQTVTIPSQIISSTLWRINTYNIFIYFQNILLTLCAHTVIVPV